MKLQLPQSRWRNAFRSPRPFFLLAALWLVSGCEKPGLEPANPSVPAVAADQQTQGENPFAVPLMRRAYANLMGKRTSGLSTDETKPVGRASKGSTANIVAPEDCIDCPPPDPGPGPTPVQPTHLYVRFKAANTDQLADLDDAGYQLSWEPMDESVAAATTVDFQSDDIAWIYTVVPVGTMFPASIQREQIQELFLFNPEDGDAQDADPWVPAPDPTPSDCTTQYDPSCGCYLQCPALRTTTTSAKLHKGCC